MTPAPVKLIVSADDFGLHTSIDEAVERAHREGIVTSASLVANGESFDHAVRIARGNRRLGVGIHLTLSGERPILPREKLPAILDRDGMLPEDHSGLCLRVMTNRRALADVQAECEAQIRKFCDTGLTPTHVDSHRHLHLFPPIFRALLPVWKKYGIRKIRRLRVPWFDYGGLTAQKIAFLALTKLCFSSRSQPCRSPDYFLGLFKSGGVDVAYVKRVLPRLKPGVTEICLHPGTDNEKIRKRYGVWTERHGWKGNWEEELALLLSPEIKEKIRSLGISLINYSAI